MNQFSAVRWQKNSFTAKLPLSLVFLRLCLTVGGMRRWGLRGYVPIPRYKPCQRELNLPNHLTPNGDDRLLATGLFYSLIFSQI